MQQISTAEFERLPLRVLLIGQLLGWDREPSASAWEPFETR
jgi:hypothetical protein